MFFFYQILITIILFLSPLIIFFRILSKKKLKKLISIKLLFKVIQMLVMHVFFNHLYIPSYINELDQTLSFHILLLKDNHFLNEV